MWMTATRWPTDFNWPDRATEISRDNLKLKIDYSDNYHHTRNDAVAEIQNAIEIEGISNTDDERPIRDCEDFGLFGRKSKLAIVLLGSGANVPRLHNPDFDFPDALIDPGSRIFMRIIRNILG
jgi:metal-dependent amidase/aminoacylase/carboxypeptidase family protein